MKKIIIIIFVFTALAAAAQKNIYLKSKWTPASFDSVKKYVSSVIGSEYMVEDIERLGKYNQTKVAFAFTNSNGRHVNVELRKGLKGGDVDMGIPADTIIGVVYITGFYPDVFKIYQNLYAPDADINKVKEVGYAQVQPVADGKTEINIGFFRNSTQTGDWVLWIREN